ASARKNLRVVGTLWVITKQGGTLVWHEILLDSSLTEGFRSALASLFCISAGHRLRPWYGAFLQQSRQADHGATRIRDLGRGYFVNIRTSEDDMREGPKMCPVSQLQPADEINSGTSAERRIFIDIFDIVRLISTRLECEDTAENQL
ncbi:MAG: hypothetical protein AAF546_06305, partial [Verrucomicrobiota bacterium]